MKSMKLIGKGMFTKCFLKDSETVLLVSTDPIKECMAFGWFPDNDLFPVIERIDIDDGRSMYEMEYYPRVSSLKNSLEPAQYEIYKTLRSLESIPPETRDNDAFYWWHNEFDKIEDEELREAMKGALDGCANCGTDIMFEISPRNVAVKNGKLILLDCFFKCSLIRELRGNR